MKLIDNLSDNFVQNSQVTTDVGDTFSLALQYLQGQQSWFWSISFGNFSINNQRLVLDYNILKRFSYALPFGIMCISPGAQIDPLLLNDFITGRVQLILLTQSEVATINENTYGF